MPEDLIDKLTPNAEETTAEEPEKPRRGRKHKETAK